ncbi:MAG TPA: DUF11 domain-containing protein [Verrucomicrobiae bacterium]|nr:DUF11 domain-containing protein [Verrucomicrobiae bacterium]
MRALIALLVLAATLTRASTVTYTYDPAGRMVTLNYGGSTNTVLSYDNNGNLVGFSTFVSANPDLSVAQAVTPSVVVVGSTAQYVLTVFNNSSTAATGIALTNSIPANSTYLSSSASQGTVAYNSGSLNWNVGSLAGGAVATVSFSVRATTLGNLTNLASVSSAQADPDLSNNSSTLVSTVIGPAELTTGSLGGNLFVSWPLQGGGTLSLQYADSLAPPIQWLPDPVSPTVNGNFYYISEPATNQTRFYRLVSSP